jgi:hypothetical protein
MQHNSHPDDSWRRGLDLFPSKDRVVVRSALARFPKEATVTPYIRQLLIHGARSVVSWRRRSTAVKDVWLAGLLLRRPFNVATVALANKSARIAWAVMTTGNRYDPRLARAA